MTIIGDGHVWTFMSLTCRVVLTGQVEFEVYCRQCCTTVIAYGSEKCIVLSTKSPRNHVMFLSLNNEM